MLVLITDLVFALLSFLSAILLAWFIIGQMKKRNFNKLKTKLSQKYKYNCYYLKENDLKKDPAAIKLFLDFVSWVCGCSIRKILQELNC